MNLKRYYPGIGFSSGLCFVLSLIGLGLLLFIDHSANPVKLPIALGAFAVAMAALGSALWVRQTVLELGFHLQEKIMEARRQGDPADSGRV